MVGNVEIDRGDESHKNENKAIEMNLLDESNGEDTEQDQRHRLNDPCLGSDAVEKRDVLNLGSESVGNLASLHLGSDAVENRTGHLRNSSSTKKRVIIAVALVVMAIIIAIIAITLTQTLTQNSERIEMEVDNITVKHRGTDQEYELFDDCYDINKYDDKPTGIYNVTPRELNQTIEVYCDMDIDGGGWTVFQYRYDGSVDFFRKFHAYENGFGSVTGEFWLGLRYVQLMTSSAPSVLRIDVAAADGTTAYQTYDDFNISEGPDYSLNIGTTSGTAGDGGYFGISSNNGLSFSTYDRSRDGSPRNCAELIHGAWWYPNCGRINLNGQYVTAGTTSAIYYGFGGMVYYPFKEKESLKSSKIMFRRK